MIERECPKYHRPCTIGCTTDEACYLQRCEDLRKEMAIAMRNGASQSEIELIHTRGVAALALPPWTREKRNKGEGA